MYPRWLWPAFALPGVVWLLILFLLPFYAVIGVAFGNIDPILQTPIPAWNPLNWNVGWVSARAERADAGRRLLGRRSCARSTTSRSRWRGCILIGYPVAYYIARHASRTKSLLLILLVLPFWISYLMRMLAWINLLAPGGYAARFLSFTHISDLLYHMGLLSQPNDCLDGQSFDRHLRADLRLHPLLHPAAVRLPRPHRPLAPGGRARPRRQPVPGLLARDAAAVEDRPAGRGGADRAAHVRRLLHAQHRLRRAHHRR